MRAMNDLIEAWRNHQHYVYRILAALVAEPERTAVTGADLTFSAGAFAQTVLAAAAALRRRGAGPDRTVAILTQANHPYMLAFRYAAHLLGATTVYIRSNNARSDEDMLPASAQVRMLAETGAGLLIADAANILRARDLCSELSCEPVTAELDVDPAGASAADLGRAVRALPPADYQPHRRLLVAYTSGSTGTPKGVCHSGQGWNNVVARFEAAVCRPLPSVFLAVTPAAQTVGAMLDGALAGGGAAVLHERFTADGVLQAWAELGVTDCYLAVPHLYALVDDTRTARTDLSRLRHVIYSGSPAAPHRIARAAQVFGLALVQSYGSTEAGPITYLGPWEHRDGELLPTVGRPYPGVQVRVCQRDPARELAAGRTGEIWVRSPNITTGYLSDPGLTSKVLRDGWLRTGDLGYWDDRGYLTLVDRIDHVIKNGGLKIYPATIEKLLMMHPDVTGAAVFGTRDQADCEQAYAAITFRPGAACTLSELRQHLSAELMPAEIPATIAQWAALPADDSGKTDKRRLRAFVETGQGTHYGLLAEQ
jgi:acyl-CoA synthetase (AMP-forming)/AMP-acid ligase II